MCGIAAILAGTDASRPVDPEELLRMRERMVARGPDGAGSWLSESGKVGLAHRRLAILDLSPAGSQPMHSHCGRYHIVFNGEIYNFRALREDLIQQGVSFASHSDTEVILHLYARYDVAMLEGLRGMFAFALWDEQKQTLLLARDHFGIKPLYLADDGKTLRAASQVKALLAGGGIETAADPAGHTGFFLWGHVPEPHTLYRHIRPLPPGSWLVAGADGSRRTGRFFNLTDEIATARAAPAPDPDALARVLRDSVAHHLESDVPVGVFLSSGLDSTTLAALVAGLAPQPPQTVTLSFEEFAGTPKDEAPLAEQVAALYGCKHNTVRIRASDFADVRARILEDMDQPTIDGVNTWLVARAAAGLGLKVALSGVGGDELFAGYNTFQTLPRMVRWLLPFSAFPGLGRGFRKLTAPWIGHVTSAKTAGLLEYGGSWDGAYLLRRGLYMPWELDHVLDSDMARAGLETLRDCNGLTQACANIDSDRWRVSALETSLYMRNQLLRDSDWAGMAHSLEIRTPLVDINLFRAVLALTVDQFPNKGHMADTAVPPLPASILHRRKTGFFVPITHWLGQSSLKGWANSVHQAFDQNCSS